jgi:hypothetical protein
MRFTAETREDTERAQRVERHSSLCASSAFSPISAVNLTLPFTLCKLNYYLLLACLSPPRSDKLLSHTRAHPA